MTVKPVRMGIVGIGALTLKAILPHLTQDDIADKVTVTALVDPVIARARESAETFNVPHAFASIDEMLEADVVDAATIVSPIGLHYDHVRKCLEAGKHVHVNKTMTTTVAEADHLIALAAEKGLRLVASPGEILRPQITEARKLIREGAIGTVAWAECGISLGAGGHADEPERTQGSTQIDPTWYFKNPGGGPMYDVTSYSLHQLTSILGPAKRVTAMSGVRIPVRHWQGKDIVTETDDNTMLLIDFGNAVFAMAHGTAAARNNPQFGACVFHGTKGHIDGVLMNGERYVHEGYDLVADAPAWDWDTQTHTLPHVVGVHRTIQEGHVYEDIMQLVRWIREGIPSLASAEHARHVIDIIESGFKSAREGRVVELSTSFDLPDEPPLG